MSDYGYREYRILQTRILGANNHVSVSSLASRVTAFVQAEDHNPVYSETLVNLLMAQGYKILDALDDADGPTYNTMVVHRIARHVGTTVSVWQATMERHNQSSSEG